MPETRGAIRPATRRIERAARTVAGLGPPATPLALGPRGLAFWLAWFTPTVYDSLHRIVGYTVLGLSPSASVWGFWGSRYSRFRMVGVRLRAAPGYLWNLAAA